MVDDIAVDFDLAEDNNEDGEDAQMDGCKEQLFTKKIDDQLTAVNSNDVQLELDLADTATGQRTGPSSSEATNGF